MMTAKTIIVYVKVRRLLRRGTFEKYLRRDVWNEQKEH